MKRTLSIILTMLMLVSVICIAPISTSAAEVDVAQTGATLTSDGTARLYFNMKAVSWWSAGTNGNGNFAYFFNNSTGKNAWSAHAKNYSGDTYYYVVPEGSWANVIFTRNNTSTAPSWDNKWNQTGDITLSSTSNYVSKFSDNSTSVTWGTAIKPASTVSVTASAAETQVGTAVTLTTALTSNADINTLGTVTYTVEPETATVTDGVFTATEAGEYTVTATALYAPNGYASLTSTATATVTITVTATSEGGDPVPEEPATTTVAETPEEPTTTTVEDTPVEPDGSITVYFSNNKWWTGTINAYVWGANEEILNGPWPGSSMTFVETNNYGESIYKVEIPAGAENIIFNDGANQTTDIPVSALYDGVGVYVTDEAPWFGTYDYVATPEEPATTTTVAAATTTTKSETPDVPATTTTNKAEVEPVGEITVYFSNAWMWTDVAIYYWNVDGEQVAWPGVAMDYVEKNDLGQDIYKATIPADVTGMIFTGKDNGTDTQSPDITDIKDGYGYYMDWNETDGNHVGSYEYTPTVKPETTTTVAATTTTTQAPETPEEPAGEFVTVFFQNNWLWDDVSVYFEGSAYAECDPWPGISMDFYDYDGTYDVYYAQVPADASFIIFNGTKNDGSGNRDQTPNIEEGFYDGICYYMMWDNGNSFASVDITEIFPEMSGGEGEEPEADPSVAGATLSLDSKLGFNIYFDINDTVMADDTAKVVFTIKGETIEVPVSELELEEDYGYYYTIELAAKEMTEVVSAQIIATDFESEVYTTSIKKYAEAMLRNYGEYRYEQDIVKAMLNYGAAAQVYFGYNTDNLANDSQWMTEEDKVVAVYDYSGFAQVTEGEGEIVKFYGASLILESDTYLKFYFQVDESKLPEGATPSITINGISGATLEKNGELWSIKMTSLAAHELSTEFLLQMDNGHTVTYSVCSYIYKAQQKTNADLVNLANALGAYAYAACVYGGE